MGKLTSADLIPGATYSGIREGSGTRTIQRIDAGMVCYNGSTLQHGAKWPTIPVWQFLLWAKECVDLPDELPVFIKEEPKQVFEFPIPANPRKSRERNRFFREKKRRGFVDD